MWKKGLEAREAIKSNVDKMMMAVSCKERRRALDLFQNASVFIAFTMLSATFLNRLHVSHQSSRVTRHTWKGKVEGLGRPPPREIMPGMAIRGVSALWQGREVR